MLKTYNKQASKQHYLGTNQYSFPGVADARDCGTVRAIVQRADSGYVREFSSYTVSVEQSDRVPGAGREDSPSRTEYSQVRVMRAGPSTQMVVFGIGDE